MVSGMVSSRQRVRVLAVLAGVVGCTAYEKVDPRSATIVQLAGLCAAGACDESFAALGVSPPRGRSDMPLRPAPEVRVTTSGVSIAGRTIVSLSQGRAAPGAFEGHVSASLRAELEVLAGTLREAAARTGEEPQMRVLVLADRAVPFATLGGVLFTLAVAGFTEYEFAIREGEELRGQLIFAAREWVRIDPDTIYERARPVRLVVRADAVKLIDQGGEVWHFKLKEGCEPGPEGCHDLEGLAARVAAIKQAYPHEAGAVLQVDGEVRTQALVALIGAVRGVECRLEPAIARGEVIPEACLLWMPSVNFEPPVGLGEPPGPRSP